MDVVCGAGLPVQLLVLAVAAVALVLIPVFLGAFALFERVLPRSQRGTLAAFAAAERGLVDESIAAAMIGAAMISVLLFPLIGLKWARMDTKAVSAEAI